MSESTARAERRALRRVAGALVTGQVNTHSEGISSLQQSHSSLAHQFAADSDALHRADATLLAEQKVVHATYTAHVHRLDAADHEQWAQIVVLQSRLADVERAQLALMRTIDRRPLTWRERVQWIVSGGW